MSADKQTHRLEFLDVIRGLAALLVVIQHIFYYQSPLLASVFTNVVNPGRIGVVTFFLVSGFVIPMSLERVTDMRKFWLGRVTRIFPAYWISFYAYVSLFLFGFHLHSDADMGSVRTYLTNFFMLQTPTKTPDVNSVTWTLFLEWIIYAVAAAKVTWFKHIPGKRFVAAFMALTGVVGIAIPLVLHARVPAGPFACLLSGMAGYVMYLFVRGELSKREAMTWVTGLIGLTTGISYINYQLFPNVSNQLQPSAFTATLSLLAGYALFYGVYKGRQIQYPKALIWVGVVSYSLYLNHTLAIILTSSLGIGPWVAIAQLAGSFALAWVGYKFVELPGIRLGKQLAKQSFTPSPSLQESGTAV